MVEFAHLHVHTVYSLLDGACRIEQLVEEAKRLNQKYLAITDHGVLYGAVKFYEECKKEGIQPIIGCEVYVAKRSRFSKEGKDDFSGNHLILLCENEKGYQNLIRLVSLSNIEGFYKKPRIDEELLQTYHEGLIALSGCMSGKIPQLILQNNYDLAKETAFLYKRIFGEDHFYLEVQNHYLHDDQQINQYLMKLSKETGIPCVATNDVHYVRKQDAEIQSVLMCIQMGSTLLEQKDHLFETNEFYLKSGDEMKQLFGFDEEVLTNTVRIAERCHFDFEFGTYHLPSFPIPNGTTHESLLRTLTYEGFEKHIQSGSLTFKKHTKEEYINRIEYELQVIHKMGFDAYFLIVSDFVRYSREHGITVGPGRGSGAGSFVAFCCFITEVDSLEYDLLFERFLNPERLSMPDFDIDFSDETRGQAIEYVKRRYGDDHVAQIITFGTFAANAAVRDIGRVLKISYPEVDSIARLVKGYLTIDEALTQEELKNQYQSNSTIHQLIDYARSIEGMPRHASTHAAGIVITEKPVSEYVPLALNSDVTVTQFDMDTIARLGLIKFDFLGIRYLSIIDHAVELIHENNPSFDILKIPFDDAQVYKTIAHGKTEGVFQLESFGIKRVLQEMQPTCFEDIIATIALYRPGPMDSIPTFIARKHGTQKISYDIPALSTILDSTYGCIVYQEQVMQICRTLAGYSFAHADLVRRAMAKKKPEVMAKERDAFLQGCMENGISQNHANKIFDEMESFASYAFNKSHATAYAVLTYRTAYLRTYYPAEYFASLMTAGQNLNPDKFGIKVLAPDINLSEDHFTVQGKECRFGFLSIRNLGIQFIEDLLKERRGNPFTSFQNFVERMIHKGLNKKQLEALIKSGCFDSFKVFRSQYLAVYESYLDRASQEHRNNINGQLDIFSMSSFDDTPSLENDELEYPSIPELKKADLLLMEKEFTGYYLSGSFFDEYTLHAEKMKHFDIAQILASFQEEDSLDLDYKEGDQVSLVGFISSFKERRTQNGALMGTGLLEDSTGSMDLIIFPKQYSECQFLLRPYSGYYLEGTIKLNQNDTPQLMVHKLVPLVQNEDYKNNPLIIPKKLFLKVPSLNSPECQTVLTILKLQKGDTYVTIYDDSSKKYFQAKDYSCKLSDKIIQDFKVILGEENVILK